MTEERIQPHLSERDDANSRDVCDAIGNLVNKLVPHGLPIPLTLLQVAQGLLVIDQTDPETGVVHQHPGGAARARLAHFLADIRPDRNIFKGGYKLYKERTRLPVVAVCEWFFINVYAPADGALLPLPDMTPTEVGNSLPRSGAATAGIVIFPEGSKHRLLYTSLMHKGARTLGLMETQVEELGSSGLYGSIPRLQSAAASFSKASPDIQEVLDAMDEFEEEN